MKETFNHKLFTSFTLWFENQLLANGEAFENQTGVFYPQNDESLPGYSVYASPYKQFVYDSAIPNANIISGVYPVGSNTFIPRGTSGLKIDYQNGRIFFDSGVNHPAGFSGSFATKEFNTYITNRDSSQFIFESAKGGNPNVSYPATGIAPRLYKAPCVILDLPNSQNKGFAFGGEDMTESTIRAITISKDLWQQDGLHSIFRDTNHLPFPIAPSTEVPLDFFGDLKSGYYNYNGIVSRYGFPGTMPWIDRVYTAKISEDGNKNDNYYASYLEFDVNTVRFPRVKVATVPDRGVNYYIKYINADIYTVQADDYYLAVNVNSLGEQLFESDQGGLYTPDEIAYYATLSSGNGKVLIFNQDNFRQGWGYMIKDYVGASETTPITFSGNGVTFDYQPTYTISGNFASVNLIAGSGFNYEVN
jgi:hypothetical protein